MGLFLTTPQFAKQVGVSKNTVINWEKQGLIQPHHVSPTGRRFYDKSQVQEVLSRQSTLESDTASVEPKEVVVISSDVPILDASPPDS